MDHANDLHDHHRMDDDGAPPAPEILPIRIGIAPTPEPAKDEDIVLKDTRPRRQAPKILNASGQPADAEPAVPEIVDARGESVTSLTWDKYIAWRKTKCPPHDYGRTPEILGGLPEGYFDATEIVAAVNAIDQATHELVGEVAELGELFAQHGPTMFFAEKREKLIDEIGDILFCGAWAFDAWGKNPLAGADDLEIVRAEEGSEHVQFAEIFASRSPQEILANPRFLSVAGAFVLQLMLAAQTHAGLLCNSFKKLRFQRRPQDVDKQVERIAIVLFSVNQILIVANSSVEEALKFNMRKLDARFPNGWQPGGGNRTGEGK